MPELDLPQFSSGDHITAGETAPDFTRPLVTPEYWSDTALSDLTAESHVLLVFYPMNGGGKSIYIWNEIQAREWHEHATVIGINIATPFDHKQFLRDRGLEHYSLFSDPTNTVAETYGVVHDLDGMTGVTEPRPAMFHLAEDRTVIDEWVATEWPQNPPYDEMEASLR